MAENHPLVDEYEARSPSEKNAIKEMLQHGYQRLRMDVDMLLDPSSSAGLKLLAIKELAVTARDLSPWVALVEGSEALADAKVHRGRNPFDEYRERLNDTIPVEATLDIARAAGVPEHEIEQIRAEAGAA